MPKLVDQGLASCLLRAAEAQARAVDREGLIAVDLQVANRRVGVRVAGVALADALLGALARRVDPVGGVIDATIAAWEGDAVQFPWTHRDIGPGGLVHGSDRTGVVAVHETGSGVVTLADLSRRRWLYRAPAQMPWWERAAPMRMALFWALGGDGRHLLHAGAVGDNRGAVLLAGSRGAGKTTVALAAAGQGFGYLADDYVLLETHGRQFTAHPIYNTASIRAAPDSIEKTVVEVGNALRESLPVRAVVVPWIRGGRPSLRPLSSADALLALAPTTVLQMPFDDGAALASLASLVRGVPCFALEVGENPAELARAVDQALGEAAR